MNRTKRRDLVLITGTYPLGTGVETFLDEEIPYLSAEFESILILPHTSADEIDQVNREVPGNVAVDLSLLDRHKFRSRLQQITRYLLTSALSTAFWREVAAKPRLLLEPSLLKETVIYLYEATLMLNWLISYIELHHTDLEQTLFYTYWNDSRTLGIGLAKRRYPGLKVITRAHRWDIYEEERIPPYIPFRELTLRRLDRLFVISEDGKEYIQRKYPFAASTCYVSRLGVADPGFRTESSHDGAFRVVSCSAIVPRKQLDRIISGLKELGQRRPHQKVEWTHIGYGPQQAEIEALAAAELPAAIRYHFLGFLPDSPVRSYYRHHEADVFVNVSSSEGIPVSIMEAQSCAIPVIATAVGGTAEIVSDEVGRLLSQDPSPGEIADAFEFFLDNPDTVRQFREDSFRNWKTRYDGRKNFTDFMEMLGAV